MTGQEIERQRQTLAKRHLLFTMNDSKERRAALLQYLLENYKLGINRKYRPILKKDKSLQKLLKSGKIEQFKIYEHNLHSWSYVRLTQKGCDHATKEKERG